MPSLGMAGASETVSGARISARKARDYSYLKQYQFKPGHAAIRRADGTTGRPVGAKDATTIYLESLPLKARQWARSTAPAVLVDARKIALPIDSDAAAPTLTLERCVLIAELQRRGIALPPSGSDVGA